jgi:hypothetical protein
MERHWNNDDGKLIGEPKTGEPPSRRAVRQWRTSKKTCK